MEQIKINLYKIPYTVEGEGENADLTLHDDKKEFLRTENPGIENAGDILKLSTRIAEENAKEKDLAKAVGEDGFITIKVLVE